jgi:hypothetical protein
MSPATTTEPITGPSTSRRNTTQPKVFRDSAVENLWEFFERFQQMVARDFKQIRASVGSLL